jgi:hypothetical protein
MQERDGFPPHQVRGQPILQFSCAGEDIYGKDDIYGGHDTYDGNDIYGDRGRAGGGRGSVVRRRPRAAWSHLRGHLWLKDPAPDLIP